MMLMPKYDLEELKKKPYDSFIKERKSLERKISHLEKIIFDEPHEGSAWDICPSPDVKYQAYLEQLTELSKYMCNRFNREFVNKDLAESQED